METINYLWKYELMVYSLVSNRVNQFVHSITFELRRFHRAVKQYSPPYKTSSVFALLSLLKVSDQLTKRQRQPEII